MSEPSETELILRVFDTRQGEQLLEAWFKRLLMTHLPPDISEAELRHREGQRALVSEILSIIEHKRGEKNE